MTEQFQMIESKRKELGLTICELSHRAGIHPSRYSQLKNWGLDTPPKILAKLQEALGLKPETLEPLPPVPKPFPIGELLEWVIAKRTEINSQDPRGLREYYAGCDHSFSLFQAAINKLSEGGSLNES